MGHSPEPGPLVLGELPGVDLDFLNGVGEAPLSFEMCDDLGVSNGVTGLRPGAVPQLKGPHLVHQALLHHPPDPLVDPADQLVPAVAKADKEHVVILAEPPELGLKRGDGLAR